MASTWADIDAANKATNHYRTGCAKRAKRAELAEAWQTYYALIDQGEAFDAVLEGSGGAWSVEGRSSAGAAWLRLSRLGLVGTATESGLGLLADSYPAPTWITDAAGRLQQQLG